MIIINRFVFLVACPRCWLGTDDLFPVYPFTPTYGSFSSSSFVCTLGVSFCALNLIYQYCMPHTHALVLKIQKVKIPQRGLHHRITHSVSVILQLDPSLLLNSPYHPLTTSHRQAPKSKSCYIHTNFQSHFLSTWMPIWFGSGMIIIEQVGFFSGSDISAVAHVVG